MDRTAPFARQFGYAAPMQILHPQYFAYLELAVDPSARQQAYRALFHNVLDKKLLARIRRSTNACGVIGDHRFKEQIEAMLGRAVPTGKRGRPRLGN
jgi:hypothetical protein